MGKDDVYFIISAILGVLGLLGVPWRSISGKVAMPLSRAKPIFLLVCVLGSLAMSGIGWYKIDHVDKLHFTMRADQEEKVYGHSYRNEVVELDGKRFDHCKFDNVTFSYHATAPVDFVECDFTTVSGTKYFLSTDNDAAKAFSKLQYFLSHLPGRGGSYEGEVDPNGNIIPYIPDFHDKK